MQRFSSPAAASILARPCSILSRTLPLASPAFQHPLRLFSSSLSPRSTATPSAPSPSSKSSSTPNTGTLTWNEFLKYRTYRRGFQIGSMVVSGVVGLGVGWGFFATVPIDPTQMIFGFDPLMVLGAGLFAFTGLSALCGPLLGNLVFKYIVLGSKRIPFTEKEDLFLQHVIRNRVDPSYQSFANPVPDYYGEKITSLHGYRRWLRNCAAYRKKRDEFLKVN
ncbi:mitochondrial import protein Pam17-domain-containing protein [Myxozyma melibiosi]|uniref:Presequence translocated-associated motor subunit PAM17 n=1 Tax=Myxozyma melibiosi TaxID=54550 RepID=A0ABR1F2B1_9ASCO